MAQYLCIMDAGKIVASDSPSGIKKEVRNRSSQVIYQGIEVMIREVESKKMSYERLSNGVAIHLSSTKDALGIVEKLHTDFDGMEIVQGSMDDVFINVTGKKMEV